MFNGKFAAQRISSLNFEEILSSKIHLFDPEQLKTLRFSPEELQKRDILISGYLREETDDEIFFPTVIISLILIRLPKFKPNDEVKLVICGYLSCGKSSLIRQITSHNDSYRFKKQVLPTICSDFYTKRYKNKLMDKEIRLNVYDLSGNPRYKQSTKIHFRNANVTVIVYDITNIESWQYVLEVMNKKYIDENSVAVIVGNKLDLEKEREIKQEDAMNLADEKGCAYFEVTATKYQDVLTLFQEISNMMMYTFPNDSVFVR